MSASAYLTRSNARTTNRTHSQNSTAQNLRPARRAVSPSEPSREPSGPRTDAEWEDWLSLKVKSFPVRFRDDLMQTGRITLWKAKRDFDSDNESGASLKTYIHLRVIGSLKNWLRDNASTVHVPQVAYQSGVRTDCTSGLDASDWEALTLAAATTAGRNTGMESALLNRLHVRSALSSLPATDRELVRLVAVEGRSFREVAQITGKSRSFVHESYQKAAGRMRQMLSDPDDSPMPD